MFQGQSLGRGLVWGEEASPTLQNQERIARNLFIFGGINFLGRYKI